MLLFSLGRGMTLPTLPLYAKSLGATLPAVGLIMGLNGLGALLCDIPAGLLISRIRPYPAMIVGLSGIGLCALGMAVTRSPVVLAFFNFLSGGALSVWHISRLTFTKEILPIRKRGKALSFLGGTIRLGNFIGPAVGGFLGKYFGLASPFYGKTVCLLIAAGLVLVFLPSILRFEETSPSVEKKRIKVVPLLWKTVSENRTSLLTVGSAMFTLQLMRIARQILFPLWGDSLGLDVAAIGVIISASSGIELATFIPAGFVMDSRGRKWTALPCILVLTVSFGILPLTTGFWTFLLVGLLAGIGNGFGAGINMTLGNDLAPLYSPARFLGLWQFISDSGNTAGPLIVGNIAGALSLGYSGLAIAGIGIIGAVIMGFFVKETLTGR